jgi:hypothetical protein
MDESSIVITRRCGIYSCCLLQFASTIDTSGHNKEGIYQGLRGCHRYVTVVLIFLQIVLVAGF